MSTKYYCRYKRVLLESHILSAILVGKGQITSLPGDAIMISLTINPETKLWEMVVASRAFPPLESLTLIPQLRVGIELDEAPRATIDVRGE